MFRRCALNEIGLVQETSVSSLRRAGEPCGNFLLRTKKLDNGIF